MLYMVIGGALAAAVILPAYFAWSASEDRKDQAARNAGIYWP